MTEMNQTPPASSARRSKAAVPKKRMLSDINIFFPMRLILSRIAIPAALRSKVRVSVRTQSANGLILL
jgi:hypothetical protein